MNEDSDPELRLLARRLRFGLAARSAYLSSEECDEEISRLTPMPDEDVVEETTKRGVDLIHFAALGKHD